jgi:hypothetical protein
MKQNLSPPGLSHAVGDLAHAGQHAQEDQAGLELV